MQETDNGKYNLDYDEDFADGKTRQIVIIFCIAVLLVVSPILICCCVNKRFRASCCCCCCRRKRKAEPDSPLTIQTDVIEKHGKQNKKEKRGPTDEQTLSEMNRNVAVEDFESKDEISPH